MKRYKQLFDTVKNTIMLEMSKYRQASLFDIKSLMTPLLIHLIAIEELGEIDQARNHHLKEIETFKLDIIDANKKRETNKRWFNDRFINDMSKEHMKRAIRDFEKKFNKKVTKQYFSLKDFEGFFLY